MYCYDSVFTDNLIVHVTGHHGICLSLLHHELVRRQNRTLQHVAIDVLEIDTFLPTFYADLRDDEDRVLRRKIYIQLFVNRFTRHMKDERDDLGLEALCTGLCSDHDTSNLEAIFTCLKCNPTLITSIGMTTVTLPNPNKEAGTAILGKKGREERQQTEGPPMKRQPSSRISLRFDETISPWLTESQLDAMSGA